MSWRRRLAELVAAGGALAACDAPPMTNFCGNALPDPCICDRTPLDAGQCVAEQACHDQRGTWDFSSQSIDPATGLYGRCVLPVDAGHPDAAADAPPADAPPGDAPAD